MDPDRPEYEPDPPSAEDEARWEAYRALMRRRGEVEFMPRLDGPFDEVDGSAADKPVWLLEAEPQPDALQRLDAGPAMKQGPSEVAAPSSRDAPPQARAAVSAARHGGRLVGVGIAVAAGLAIAALALPGLRRQEHRAGGAPPAPAASVASGARGPIRLAFIDASPCQGDVDAAEEFARLTEPAPIAPPPSISPIPSMAAPATGASTLVSLAIADNAPPLTSHVAAQARHPLPSARAHLVRMHYRGLRCSDGGTPHIRAGRWVCRRQISHARTHEVPRWWGH